MSHDTQELTLRVYDTVADKSVWTEVLDRFVEAVDAQGSIVFEWAGEETQDRLTAPLHSSFYTADGLATYLEKCAHLEARDQDVLRAKTGPHDSIDLIDDTILAASKTELQNHEHMHTLRRFGIFHRAAGVMNKDNQRLSLFSVQFKDSRGPITHDERRFMGALLPHFAKALDIGLPMRQLSQRYSSVLAAMDRLALGMCLLDASGRVVSMNEEFQRQKDTYGAFRLTPGGHLRMSDDHGQRDLAALMNSTRHHGKFGARPRKEAIATSDEDSFLCIEVSPLARSEEIGTKPFSGYVVTSTDTSRPVQCNIAPMAAAFGFTRTELALVEAIGEGLTNPQIAELRSRSVATINAQVKSILAKSQCSTRAQFVRMMMRFGANFLAVPGE